MCKKYDIFLFDAVKNKVLHQNIFKRNIFKRGWYKLINIYLNELK